MRGAGHSTRAIARELGLARNTVLRYLKSPEAIRPKPRSRRGSKLDPYTEHIDRRLGDGLENCVVLLRELRDLGYDGSNTILSEYVRPRRRRRQPEATMRFETAPGEQAQVDWGSLSYIGADGKQRRVWVFVMTLGWSRACYVELVRKADTAAFIQCHVNAFEYPGGVPRRAFMTMPRWSRWAGTKRSGRSGTSGCWISPCAWVSRLGCASPTEPRPRARWRTGSSTCGATCGPASASPRHHLETGRPEPARAGVVRRGGQRAGAWDDPPGAVGDAGRGAAPPGEAARSGHAGAVPAGGPQGVAGRFRQLGGLPVRRPLEVGRGHGAGGGAPGHGGDLGW